MLKTFNRITRFLIEALCGIILLALVAGGFSMWKLSQGPIDLARFIPYVQSEFAESTQGQNIEIDNLVLNWNGFENPLGLKARNITLSNDNGAYLFSPLIDMDISYRWLILGQLKFQTIWIRNTAISITKTEDGAIQITGQEKDKTDTEPKNLNPTTLSLESLIGNLPDVETLWIDRARVIYRDEVADKIQSFDPATFFIEMKKSESQRNLYGFLTFPFGDDDLNNIARLNFSTQNNPRLLNVSGSLKETPMGDFTQFLPATPDGFDINTVVNADIQAQLDNEWKLQEMVLNIDAERGQIDFPLNDDVELVDFSDLKMRCTHDPKTETLTIDYIKAKINDTATVALSGDLSEPHDSDLIAGTLKLSIQNLPHSYIQQYWPKSKSENGAYRWLVNQMNGGTFNNLNITTVFDLSATERNDGIPLPPQLLSVKGDVVYDGLNIKYHPKMAIAKNVKGSGRYDDVSLTLNVDKAEVGGMITKDATLYFDDIIRKGKGVAQLVFPVKSNAQNVFDYIAGEPINAFKKTNFKPKNTKGDVEAIVELEFPLIKGMKAKDVKVKVNGTIANAEIPNAVKGLALSGGPYDIFATTQEVKVKGVGQLDRKPIKLDWHEYFPTKTDRDYASKGVISVTANNKIRRAFAGAFSDFFNGDTSADITYIKSSNNRDATVDLKLDVTAANIIVSSLGVNKKSGQASSAAAEIKLRDGHLVAVNDLNVKGRGFSIGSGNLSFKNKNGETLITQGKLNNIAFKENRINVVMTERDDVLRTNVTGKFLDVRPILSRNKSEGDGQDNSGRAREYGVTVDEIRTADAYTIKSPQAYIRLNKSGKADQFELDGKLGEDGEHGDLLIRYTPEVADGLTLRVESNNAGETLRAFNLYPYINGGELQIAGVPTAGGRFGDVRGRARINNFDVDNAPILVRLVNALSFQNFMRAGKLSFARLESDFEWKLGDKGDIYKIRNGKTSGASIALTFDGFIDRSTDNMDITGTAAPLSELNNFIGKIPLLGKLLTGGDALLAATYSVKGQPSDPSVGVNPLSILTPGIIRKLLFESTPKAEDQKPKEPENTTFDNNERTKGLN